MSMQGIHIKCPQEAHPAKSPEENSLTWSPCLNPQLCQISLFSTVCWPAFCLHLQYLMTFRWRQPLSLSREQRVSALKCNAMTVPKRARQTVQKTRTKAMVVYPDFGIPYDLRAPLRGIQYLLYLYKITRINECKIIFDVLNQAIKCL